MGCLQDNRKLKNFTVVKFYENGGESKHEYTIDVWGKNYFVKYKETHPNGYQLYHETEGLDDNEIDAQSAVLKAAYKFAIEKAKITLY